MTLINVVTRNGMEQEIRATNGVSLMENLRDNGIDDIAALCGGNASCGTCHVYIDDSFLAHLPARSDDEEFLLEGSLYRTDRSRLSCQIKCGPELEGVRLEVAPAE
jgi:2Fe-2S ferredoxin